MFAPLVYFICRETAKAVEESRIYLYVHVNKCEKLGTFCLTFYRTLEIFSFPHLYFLISYRSLIFVVSTIYTSRNRENQHYVMFS